MDKFVTVKKTSSLACSQAQGSKVETEKQRPIQRFSPYGAIDDVCDKKYDHIQQRKNNAAKILEPLVKDGKVATKKALTKRLLDTLSDEANPITHSDIYARSDYVTSAASGHQRGDGRGSAQKAYHKSRGKKLADQLPEKSSNRGVNVLYNVRIYINGYLADTTDIEMKRIVTLAGGQVLQTPSGATHILTSQQLNGSKTHKLLTTKAKVKPHVVRPEWVTDSINAGRRLSEREYSVIKDSSVMSLAEMLATGSSSKPIEVE
ncbi:unnamed protein product [Somion occarium]|uniref:BRCT domain-containing protein n=1 Tax=Somion occarium TaxID=3059160 RepID=A0ABP1D1B2_9APHY